MIRLLYLDAIFELIENTRAQALTCADSDSQSAVNSTLDLLTTNIKAHTGLDKAEERQAREAARAAEPSDGQDGESQPS